MIALFSKGLLLGFAIAAPVGPIGIHCIRKTLRFGKASGFCAGLGAALADTLYGVVSIFSVTVISQYLIAWRALFKLVGGIFLIYLAWSSLRSRSSKETPSATKSNFFKDFVETFFLTLLNPLTLIAFLGGFAILGLVEGHEHAGEATFLILGVFSGSTFWWLILSEGVSRVRDRIGSKTIFRINQITGFLLGVLGLWSLTSFFINWYTSLAC